MKLKVRSLYVPTPGYSFIAFDLSQAETWVTAFLAREPRMKEALLKSEIHSVTAAAIFRPPTDCEHLVKWGKKEDGSRFCTLCNIEVNDDERYIGKKSNHGNSYRQGVNRWVQVINAEGKVSVSTAQGTKYNQVWHGLYPGIKTWWTETENELAKSRTLITPYKRRRYFSGLWGDELFKEATAFVPQSTVADHALGMVQPELGIEGGILSISRHPTISRWCRLVHTAHDSVMLEVPRNRENEFTPIVRRLFERPLVVNGEQFTIPVDGEYGDRWGELKPIPSEWMN